MGLEQEFFLVDEDGIPSNRADEFLARCGEVAEDESLDPECFAPECVRSLVEVSTPPATSLEGLSAAYLDSVGAALRAARDLGLRLYPLATYPLPSGVTTFEVVDDTLRIPGFEELRGELFREAVTLGIESAEITAYLDSIFAFAGEHVGAFESIRAGGRYRNTETEILESFGVQISRDTGLRLVREACDELERQVYSLQKREKVASAKARADEN